MKSLRVLSIGAGAIGTYIGGSLALLGHELTFVERPQVVDELKISGLSIAQGAAGVQKGGVPTTHIIPPDEILFINSIDEALTHGTYDIALYALKSFDTPLFISELQTSIPNLRTFPPILCLSNGVANEPALIDALGQDRVIAGTVTSAVGRQGTGNILVERLRGVGIAADHPISGQVTAAMNEAGLNAHLFQSAVGMKWSKMLTNLIANASSAILDMTPAEIFADSGLYKMEIEQLRETLKVMRAKKIRVVDLPGTPVRLLAFAVRSLPLAVTRPFLTKAVGSGRGGKMPSFYIDLHQGRGKSEVEYLNGAVVRTGESLDIPTPVNRLLTDTLLKLTHGEYLLSQFAHQPERLLENL
jgi:2-dehydropantoate 2-reductase